MRENTADPHTNIIPLTAHTRDSLMVLLTRVSHHDQDAFNELYEATSAKLYGIVLRILVQEPLAEESLQEIYLKIWHHAGNFDATKKVSPITWMATIARNHALDQVRKRCIETDEDINVLDNTESDDPSPDHLTAINKELQRLKSCLSHLDKPRDDMIVLAYTHGFSREELAKKYKLPLGTVKTYLHRSLKKLKDCLEP